MRIALDLRTDQSDLERYFYLKRNILRATTEVGSTKVVVVATHAEAYAKDGTKKQHIDRFKEELDRWADAGELVLGAGDLNTLPPGSEKQHAFPDSACTNEDFVADDYREEAAWLEPLYASYEPEIPLVDYQADNARYFSHTTDKNGFWNRKLDYVFTNAAVVPGSGLVHQDEEQGGTATMPLSDHAPVTVEIEIE
jgi:endonuclease/exonuclease/phosphatase family metal-dependent hydrolase